MIKIIKPGKTDFRLTCDKCGCVFEYNVEDIDDSYVKCPTCGKMHYGFQGDQLTYTIGGTKPIGTFRLYSDGCENCPTYQMLQNGKTYVGDIPCQWCSKNPYQVTCSDTSTATYRNKNKSAGVTYTTGATTGGTYSDETHYSTQDPEDCLDNNEEVFYTCTAEGVTYNFAASKLGTYKLDSLTLDDLLIYTPKSEK